MQNHETVTERIEKRLFAHQDPAYRVFQAKLMPGVPLESIIGVRTPILRRLAQELAGDPDIEAFLNDLPHRYYDENNLHGFLISTFRDYERAVCCVDALLPYVDNWATCDLLSPKAFAKNRDRLPEDIDRWLASDHPYTVRFGMEMIMTHFLDGDFDPRYLDKAAAIRSKEYYVNMMIAWLFATALAKQWDTAVVYLQEKRLDPWVHNMTIRKATESYRITGEQKAYLKSLRYNRV